MSENVVLNQLQSVIDQVSAQREHVGEEFVRIQVLVTGTLQLLGQENVSTLRGLYGSPEQVKTHLIHSVSKFGEEVVSLLNEVETKLRAVSEGLRKP
jgi:hypothetical protein